MLNWIIVGLAQPLQFIGKRKKKKKQKQRDRGSSLQDYELLPRQL